MAIRAVIADDYLVVRVGVQAILEAAPDIEVAGVAGSGEEALRLVQREAPDVLVLDMSLPDLSGPEILHRLRDKGSPAKVLALSAHDDDEYVIGVLRSGAAGYLLKDDASVSLVEAVRGVACGEVGWFSRRIMAKLAQRERIREMRAQPGLAGLSRREHQVLEMIAAGLSNQQIAGALALSNGTVKNYVTVIYDKLGLHTRGEAMAWAWQHGIAASLDGASQERPGATSWGSGPVFE